MGKTTLTANLFGAVHKWNQKNVLIVDMDPQANLSQLLVHQRIQLAMVEQDKSIISAFEPGRPLGKASPADELSKIRKIEGAPVDPQQIAHIVEFDGVSRKRFDLIVGQFEIAKYTLPQNLARVGDCLDYFQRFIDLARVRYDLVVLDVSPASSHLTLAAMRAATHVLAPVKPDKYSLRGLKAMHRLMDELFSLKEQPEFISIMNDIASESDASVEQSIRADSEFGPSLLKTTIPHSRYFLARNTGVAANLVDKLAINATGWYSSNIRETLRSAADEILNRINANAQPLNRNATGAREVGSQIHAG